MKVETSLIELRRVTLGNPNDVEFIRTVRNSFLNQNVYADNHFIEVDEHQSWFLSLDSEKDWFFIIVEKVSRLPVGITGCCQKKAPASSGEISIYLTKENKLLASPFHAMTLLLYFMFDTLKLDRAFAKLFKKNSRAIRFNAAFGFRKFFEDDCFIKTEITAEDFKAKTESFRRFLS